MLLNSTKGIVEIEIGMKKDSQIFSLPLINDHYCTSLFSLIALVRSVTSDLICLSAVSIVVVISIIGCASVSRWINAFKFCVSIALNTLIRSFVFAKYNSGGPASSMSFSNNSKIQRRLFHSPKRKHHRINRSDTHNNHLQVEYTCVPRLWNHLSKCPTKELRLPFCIGRTGRRCSR